MKAINNISSLITSFLIGSSLELNLQNEDFQIVVVTKKKKIFVKKF